MKILNFRGTIAATLFGCACFASGLNVGLARAPGGQPEVTVLLSGGKTVLGQQIAFPVSAPAKVTAAIVTMKPGQSTGWHRHDVPLFGYMLEGEITVDYGPHGKRVYRKGDSLLEAVHEAHDGTSTGDVPARILAVFAGAEGLKTTVPMSAPK